MAAVFSTIPPASGGRDAENSVVPQPICADDWPAHVIYYREFLASRIRPAKLIMNMKLWSFGHLQEIMNLDLDNRCHEAAEKFLSSLLEESNKNSGADAKSLWSLFNQALKSEYPMVHEIIVRNSDTECDEHYRQLINFFIKDICIKVDPKHLLPQLVADNLLRQAESERLYRICESHGPTDGAIYMIGHIHRNAPDWYDKFVNALLDNGYDDIVELMDNDTYKKKMQQRSAAQGAGCSNVARVSDEGETVMEDVCEGYVPRPLSYCAPRKSDTGGSSKQPVDEEMEYRNNGPGMEAAAINEEETCINTSFVSATDVDMTEENAVDGSVPVACSPVSGFNRARSDVHHPLKDENQKGSSAQKELGRKNVLSSLKDGECEDNSNAIFVDDHDSGDETEEVDEPINLREYQEELAEDGLAGTNVIVCAPTGCGKTHVAMKIMQNHLQQRRMGVLKVVFLANTVALVSQQYKVCRHYLKFSSCQISGELSEADKVPLNELVIRNDILVMTPQILLNALDRRILQDICVFTLLVFDECHHTDAQHPYNRIMHHYIDSKFSQEEDPYNRRRLPQVIGLTASVGVGNADSQEKAKVHILSLCAHLDADYISTVNHNLVQLAHYTTNPTSELITVTKREDDQFGKKIIEIMKTIENMMVSSDHAVRADFKASLKPPAAHGTVQYTTWVTQLTSKVAKLEDAAACRCFWPSRAKLELYNTALGINEDCDTEDALNFLLKKFEEHDAKLDSRAIDTDIFLKDLFEKNIPYLKHVSRAQANSNPLLIKLEKLLMKAFIKVPDSRVMVFVKTRALAEALVQWMERQPQLKILKPSRFVGTGQSAEKGGMTKSKQEDVLKYFRDGNHYILVATSVAEEGLDIRACNLVIRYNYVTNEIATVQSRGRARAENSRFVTLVCKGKGLDAKTEINSIRESMTHTVISEVQKEMKEKPEIYHQKKEGIQRREKERREFDHQLSQQRAREPQDGEVAFYCCECRQFAFMSSDIRTLEWGKLYIIKDTDFKDRSFEREHPTPGKYSRGMESEKKLKLYCIKCRQDWGIVVQYRSTKFPVVKIVSFVMMDGHSERSHKKKWKDFVKNYPVQEMTNEELQEYQRKAREANYVF